MVVLFFADFVHHGLECLRVMDSQLGEHFAIESNIGFFQTTDKSRIVQRIVQLAQSCSNAHNPESAHVTLAELPADVGILACMEECFLGTFDQAAVGATETLGEFEDFFVALMADGTGFDSWHIFFLGDPEHFFDFYCPLAFDFYRNPIVSLGFFALVAL